MQQVLGEVAATHAERLAIVSIDVLKDRAALSAWRVQVIPTQVFLDGQGRELERHVGYLSAAAIEQVFWRHGILLDEPKERRP